MKAVQAKHVRKLQEQEQEAATAKAEAMAALRREHLVALEAARSEIATLKAEVRVCVHACKRAREHASMRGRMGGREVYVRLLRAEEFDLSG